MTIALTLTEIPSTDRPEHFVVAVIRDVSQQKQAEEDLLRTNEAMRNFVAVASHDLRTPITGIIGFGRMLRDRPDAFTQEQRDEFLSAIVRSGERASRLIDDLLTVSKIDASLVEVRPEALSLASVATELAALLDPVPALDIDPALCVVVDRDHLARIVENLLSNANRYGRPPIVVSAAAVSDTSVELRVCDAGDGIPQEHVSRLFEKFLRVPGVSAVDSNGLGLSIVRGLAVANGGEVTYERTDAAATCFCVRLPRCEP